jgi:Family of unknown function (DUF5683)
MKQIQNTLSFTKAAFLLVFILCGHFSFAQKNPKPLIPVDTTPVTTKISAEKKIDATKEIKKDTAAKKHSPKIAATRSAIFPGLGQIYNKKYWKLPIVYGAMGVSAYIFVDNIKTYREYRFGYNARYKASLAPPLRDSTDFFTLAPLYKAVPLESLRAARNKFRQYVDYSVLFFILMWGLNVVDATVDAHLQSFDVSPNLSLSIEPGRSQLAGTNGISLVLHIGKK